MLLAFLLAAWVASPLWVGLMMGAVMAFTAQPLHALLARKLHGRERVSAAIATLVGGACVAGGGVVAAFFVLRELLAALALAQRGLDARALTDHLGPRSLRAFQLVAGDPGALSQRLQQALGRMSEYAAQAAGVVFQTATGALLLLVIALATMYYVLVDWHRVASRLERILPLDRRDTRALMIEFRDVGRGAFVATVLSALVQGVLAWIGFAIAGVPQAMTWGAMVATFSFVPLAGTALVWIPVSIYEIGTRHLGAGVFVAAWGALVVMAVTDYVIRPFLVGSRGHTHPLLALVSLLGGISVFGLPGLIAGPVVMSLFVATLRIYERDTAGVTPSSLAA
jgi:predicted PurR-regulated permease PerM